MALSRIFFMAARTIASNPRLRKELGKAAQKSYQKAKPYINETSEKIQKAAKDAAKKSPPEKDFFTFMGRFVKGFSNSKRK